jgi:tRNA (guanine37-N1)-methyltransferase
MIRFDFLTIFPDIFTSYLNESILKRAQKAKKVVFAAHDIRAFATDKHRTVDDRPYGGGVGMVMKIEPLVAALQAVPKKKKRRVLLMSAKGSIFTQADAKRLSKYDQVILICPRYEGVDERIVEYIDEEVSIGEFVLTGGELPAMIIADAVTRLLPGVLGKDESSVDESHSTKGQLEYPHYTRPEVFQKKSVPKELLSGNHKDIATWRNAQRKKVS